MAEVIRFSLRSRKHGIYRAACRPATPEDPSYDVAREDDPCRLPLSILRFPSTIWMPHATSTERPSAATKAAAQTSGSILTFFGHQIVAHLKPSPTGCTSKTHHNPVDGHDVPVPHFGVVLSMETWEVLADRLRKANIAFIIEPYIRFKGEVGEQATMFAFSIPRETLSSSRPSRI